MDAVSSGNPGGWINKVILDRVSIGTRLDRVHEVF